MRLEVKGHPLHTRALAVWLAERADGKLDVGGELVDLRKRGFVPVGADLQTSGIVHHMRLAGVVDRETRALESIVAAQPAVAFEPSALSTGESCRDPIDRIQELRNTPLDASFSRRAAEAIGGPRGCSHILTLAHLLGSSVAWALERERQLHGEIPARRAGERLFRRDLILDGHETDGQSLQVAIQLTDVHFAPSPPIARPMERFAAELEVRALADVETPTFSLRGIECGWRERGLTDLDRAPWRSLDERLSSLVGLPLLGGFTSKVREQFGDAPAERPLCDALLMVGPALIQIIAAMSETWPSEASRSPSLMGTGGLPDSCYMWRRDGALHRVMKGELDSGTLKKRTAS